MNPIKLIFNPVRRAAHLFFKANVTLRRGEGGVHVVLADTPQEKNGAAESTLMPSEFIAERPAVPAPAVLRQSKSTAQSGRSSERKRLKAEAALALAQLSELLDRQPGTRQALRHLDFVEQCLRKKGFRALDKLPLPLMRKALEQFEGLVTNWAPEGLANLRSKMAVAVLRREKDEPVGTAGTTPGVDPEGDLDASVLPEAYETGPGELDGIDETEDEAALAAAYAALSAVPPVGVVELQGELGSRSAKSLSLPLPRASDASEAIQIRTLT